MSFGDPYTFEELARTLRIEAPARLTLSAGQLLDLLDAWEKDDQAAYDRGYDVGFTQGADAFEDAHVCEPAEPKSKSAADATWARMGELAAGL